LWEIVSSELLVAQLREFLGEIERVLNW
jgi:hypothetical protein